MNIRKEKLEIGDQDYVKALHSGGREEEEEKMWIMGRRDVTVSTRRLEMKHQSDEVRRRIFTKNNDIEKLVDWIEERASIYFKYLI